MILSPSREVDHHIHLKEDTEPVNVKPYRYAYFQKAKIEKQVHDMLKLGLILVHFHLLYCWLKRKMGPSDFALIIEPLMMRQSKIDFPF